MGNRDRAIVVGLSAYPGLDQPLSGPETDALAFFNWLIDPKGGNVPDDGKHITRILSSSYPAVTSATDAEPTPASIVRAFERLQDEADEHQRRGEGSVVGDRLYLYFAGHGFGPDADEDEAALLAANATSLRVHHVLGRYTADWFSRAGYFKQVLLFMDCCRESYSVPALYKPFRPLRDYDAVTERKWFYGFGTKFSRLSRERPFDDGVVRGVFTTTLLAGLRGAAVAPDDQSGRITADSLANYLYTSMSSFLAPADRDDPDAPKVPDVDFDPGDKDSLVIATIAPKVPSIVARVTRRVRPAVVPQPTYAVTVHLSLDKVGAQLEIEDGDFRQVATVAAAPAEWRVQLQRGRYAVKVVATGAEIAFAVPGAGDVDVTF